METLNEKINKIKKALKCCTNLKEKCENKKCYLIDKLEYNYCERQLKKDCLEIINELENLNETITYCKIYFI